MNLFLEQFEEQAIDRIVRFSKIACKMGFEICLGFSGGKDSQVCYHLCKRAGITFKAYYNHCFESGTTRRFIRENYPDVIYRRVVKEGFVRNIQVNHKGLLPTVQIAYCCNDYKHNYKFVDDCSITGVRKAESYSRRKRTALSLRNKTVLKKNKAFITDYFEEHCQSVGDASIIALKPIVDWSDGDVWEYIKKYDIPINPEYKSSRRIGCIVCPKANFNSNYAALIKYPKLIDSFISAKEKGAPNGSWLITASSEDCREDKCYYICRWLNHSFMPFTKKQWKLYELVKNEYAKIISKKSHKNLEH